MWTDRRLLELLDLDHPIIQAPMAGASTPAMAAAAANAGCLGSLGCAMMTPEDYRADFQALRDGTNRRVNMNFFCHKPPEDDPAANRRAVDRLAPLYDEAGIEKMPDVRPTHFPYGAEMHAEIMETRPGVVSFHFGLPEERFVEELKADGALILCSATTAEEARDLENRGVDVIIAQGWEAGGHQGFYLRDQPSQIGTMALVPAVVDAVDVPVVAAGGIADGRGIVAALALGAAGVQIGTAFLTTKETGSPDAHRKVLLDADGADTRMTRAFSGRPARGVVNRYMDYMEQMEDTLPEFPLMNTLTGPLRKAGASAGSPDMLSLWSGQAVGLNKAGTVAGTIDRLVGETRDVLANLPAVPDAG
ncbi:MAG: DUF561 domain-containing protein [Pseudomonadota bacterium]